MAVTINASTTAGLVQTADTSGVLALQTAGTTAVTVDASQNVGIGTTTPSFPSGTGLAVFNTSVPRIKLTNSTTGDTSTDGTQLLVSGSDFYIQQREAASVIIATNGSDRVTIDSAGTLKTFSTISVGNTTPSTSGAGITFPATQSASSNANTLDDYEEGTWTPSLGGTATYVAQTGSYIKIGRLVTVWFDLQINVIGTGSATSILGLPFTGSGVGQGGSPTYWEALSVAPVYVAMRIDSGTTQILLSGATAATANLTASFSCLGSSSRLVGTLTYSA